MEAPAELAARECADAINASLTGKLKALGTMKPAVQQAEIGFVV